MSRSLVWTRRWSARYASSICWRRACHSLEQQTTALDAVDARIQRLADTAAHTEETVTQLAAPDGELESQRRQLQQLSATAVETQAALTAICGEHLTLEDVRRDLVASHEQMQTAIAEAGGLKRDLDDVRGVAAQITREHAELRQASRQTRDHAAAAAESVADVERKLEPLRQVQDLSIRTEEKLALLNALAEHVNQKTKALESQKHTLDRAVVEANRLNEMVWSMDVQIGKLQEGLKEAARSQETVSRIERLTEETEQKVDLALRMRNELARDVSRFERDGRVLVDTLRTSLDMLGIEKKRLDDALFAIPDGYQKIDMRRLGRPGL